MDRDEVEVHKKRQQRTGQYPPVLTEQAWSIKNLLYGQKVTKNFAFVGQSEKSRAGKMGPS